MTQWRGYGYRPRMSPIMWSDDDSDRGFWQRRNSFGVTHREELAWWLVAILTLVLSAIVFPGL